MKPDMKKRMNETLAYAEHLPRCPFLLVNYGPDKPIAVGGLAPDNQVCEGALEVVRDMVEARMRKPLSRMTEELSTVFFSRKFQTEWASFVGRILENGEIQKASWLRLSSKETSDWFRDFSVRWGIWRMSGWLPEIDQGNEVKDLHIIYRCENCGQRCQSRTPAWSSFYNPPLGRHDNISYSEIAVPDAACCESPSLRPIRIRLDVEAFPDVSSREWGELRQMLFFALTGKWDMPRGRTDSTIKQNITPARRQTDRGDFCKRLKREARRLFPKAINAVKKPGRRESIIGSHGFRTFWKEELKEKNPQRPGIHDVTIARALTGLMLSRLFQKDINKHKFHFTLDKLKRYTKGVE